MRDRVPELLWGVAYPARGNTNGAESLVKGHLGIGGIREYSMAHEINGESAKGEELLLCGCCERQR